MAHGSLGRIIRGLAGVSPAALGVWITQGPWAARPVMWQPPAFARLLDRRASRSVSFWDLVRAFPIEENVSVFAGGWYDGCTAPLERYILGHLIRHFKPRTIVEVGTFRGCTTRIMLDNLPRESTIYTLDLPVDQER